jgi:murein DD-endopeptidase MepM/ murein hydrolase activator NlpD
MKGRQRAQWLIWLGITVALWGCSPRAVNPPEGHPPAETMVVETEEIQPTSPPVSPTPSPTLTPTGTPTSLPYPTPGQHGEHFLFTRPIDTWVDFSYRYGSNQKGHRATHHGVELLAEFGTPVQAAADGEVVAAGEDLEEVYGPYPYFYGQLVILKHTDLLPDTPLYTLYGHLSKVLVEPGQQVSRGDEIGEVGFSGAAVGSHLHFEVRVGENDYDHTRNPELWMVPFQEEGQYYGALAGQLIGTQGYPIPNVGVEIQRLDEEGEIEHELYVTTYADTSVNGDDRWGENFGVSDLVPGTYRVQFVIDGLKKYTVEVRPGQVSLIEFSLEE